MAFRNKEGFTISFDCEDLISELKSDINEFGENERVNVWCKKYKGATLYVNYDFIVDTIGQNELNSDETLKVMEMGELLKLLEKQNDIL